MMSVTDVLFDRKNGLSLPERPKALAGKLGELWEMINDVSENLPPATLRWRIQNWLSVGQGRVERGLGDMKVKKKKTFLRCFNANQVANAVTKFTSYPRYEKTLQHICGTPLQLIDIALPPPAAPGAEAAAAATGQRRQRLIGRRRMRLTPFRGWYFARMPGIALISRA